MTDFYVLILTFLSRKRRKDKKIMYSIVASIPRIHPALDFRVNGIYALFPKNDLPGVKRGRSVMLTTHPILA
jgi:hypothetical protein